MKEFNVFLRIKGCGGLKEFGEKKSRRNLAVMILIIKNSNSSGHNSDHTSV